MKKRKILAATGKGLAEGREQTAVRNCKQYTLFASHNISQLG